MTEEHTGGFQAEIRADCARGLVAQTNCGGGRFRKPRLPMGISLATPHIPAVCAVRGDFRSSRPSAVSKVRLAIRIALSRDTDQDAEAKVLTVAWAAPSPYRRREIVGLSSVRPMPMSARLALIRTLRKAHRWLDELLTEPTATIETIAVRESKSERSIRMNLLPAFLSPDLVKAAVDGRFPAASVLPG